MFIFCPLLNALFFGNSRHMCMVMRGVEKAGTSTTTSCLLGSFKSDKQTRQEFFTLVNAPGK
jgi:GTP cyclohydrolase I